MSSLPPDPYKALGVAKDATQAEIRSAHRKLVLKCHPDKVQDPKLKEEKQREFQQVQQAYELLCDEAERTRYDDKVRLEELRREARNMTSTTTSSPRNPRRHETRYYDVREAEPRPSTFSTSPHGHGVYGQTPPSRSWDENLYGRGFDEKPRSARKSASYEYDRERAKREDERRRREEDKEWMRQQEKAKEKEREERHRERETTKEREKEREKESAKKDKDRRKEERKEDKKKAEKDRRKEADDKHRRRKSPYMEDFPGDDDEAIHTTSSSSKPDKKKSSNAKKYDEAPEVPSPPPTSERERKNSENLDNAIRYLSRSGAKPPPIARAQTYHPDVFGGVRHVAPIAVPTPPPAAASVFAPPPMASRDVPLDEEVKRQSGRPRRMSHDTVRSSKEKSHKKSSPSKETIVVDGSPASGARHVPSFTKSHSIPISGLSDSHRMPPLSRSSTENYSRPQAPGLERASTWMPESDLGRERSRSRHARVYTDDSSEDDRDRERRHRRSHRTQSPEHISEIPIQTSTTTRYTVSSGRKAVPISSEESPRISKKTSYPIPNSSVRREPRQAYFSHSSYEEEPMPGWNVNYSKQFSANEIQFSGVQHSLSEELIA
ncbi:DnaJ-domain-containing protein [Rostrohypoxylon terebratum]|nr:DnaJ-domain-containing protein [Rostrohypoxylon terebratum]